MKASVVRRQYYGSDTGNTITVYAEPGFPEEVPKAYINLFNMHAANLDSLDTTYDIHNQGVGFHSPCIGTTGAFFTSVVSDAVGTSDNSGGTFSAASASGTFFCLGRGASLGGSNLFRTLAVRGIPRGIVTTTSSTTGRQPDNVKVDQISIFMTGAGVTCARRESGVATAANTEVTIDVGFTPDIIIALGKRFPASNGIGFSYGFAERNPIIGSTAIRSQGSVGRIENTGTTTMFPMNRTSDNRILAFPPTNTTLTTVQNTIEVTRMTATGFVYTPRGANTQAGQTIAFLAIKTDKKFFGTVFSTNTTVSSQNFNLNFTPCVIFGAATGSTSALNITYSTLRSPDSDSWVFFAGTGGTNYSKNKYQNGTITTTLNSTAVSGTGTSFAAIMAEGDRIYTAAGVYIGDVNVINSNTSLVLKANTASVVTSSNYYTTSPVQFSLVQGNEHGNTASISYLGTFSKSLVVYQSTSGNQSVLVQSVIDASTFNRSRRAKIDYQTISSASRWGWVVAFEGDNDPSRGEGVS